MSELQINKVTLTLEVRGRQYKTKLTKPVLYADLTSHVKIMADQLKKEIKYFHRDETKKPR